MIYVCPKGEDAPSSPSQARRSGSGAAFERDAGKMSAQGVRGVASPGNTGSSVWRRQGRPSGLRVAPGRSFSSAGGNLSSTSLRFVARGSKPMTVTPAKTLKSDQSVPSKTPASITSAPGRNPRTSEKGDTSVLPAAKAAGNGVTTAGPGSWHGALRQGSVDSGAARSPACQMRCSLSNSPKSGQLESPERSANGFSSRAVLLARSIKAACLALLWMEKYSTNDRKPSTQSW
mmetsp:Transcript_26428/g.87653  ORF Transcript_26428/g.87653 Transcript_26428/m.87653 type:complete len:232 (-) Transcript_26428:264-959(-)